MGPNIDYLHCSSLLRLKAKDFKYNEDTTADNLELQV